MRKIKLDASPLQLDLFASDAMPVLLPQPESTAKNPFSPEPPPTPSSPPKRSTELGGIKIEYELRRSKRRTIGFLINENGLRITAPRWATLKSVEEAIREKERWITGKLHYFLQQHEKRQAMPHQLKEGIALPYLGTAFLLRLQNGPTNNIAVNETTGELIVTAADIAALSTVEGYLRKWFQEKARLVFSERLPIYAAILGVRYNTFSLSSARQRWGSCSASGNIHLNWRLVYFPVALIDYVIVHELAHLREMNHSKRFWDIVSQACPDYKTARKQLNQENMRILPIL